jgi:transposase-like protein
MRYPASEKLEIIRLVEQSHLPARRALQQIGIPRSTFYRWCYLYRTGGPEALDDRSPRPDRVWNRIPRIVTLDLDETERLLKSHANTRRCAPCDLTRPLEHFRLDEERELVGRAKAALHLNAGPRIGEIAHQAFHSGKGLREDGATFERA